ncbi:MAG: hypothetical protein DI606_19610 [Sphingobium sp.]|uniref:DUF2274 domain-containing protein n=1 Tax=Sphingobium sp. TaxID=1912891 RepID=UPI000DB5D561|nr:MAG: hypothetical protein DI606_19610 [Sphingobium sp.]
MPELKLPKLPDRTPIKLPITVTPDLHQMLQDYAALYAAAYGREEPIALSGQSAPSATLQ